MHQAIEILLIEDNPSDVYLIREALLQGEVPKKITVVTNGEDALSYLLRFGRYRNVPRPDLVLLDLNLPKIDGRQVLEIVKQNNDLRHIPVLILTTSEAEADVVACYDNHANCYLSKPSNLIQLLELVAQVESFWLGCVALPAV